MPIQFRCPECSIRLSISSRKAGKEIVCPRCGAKANVPQLEADAPGTLPDDARRESPSEPPTAAVAESHSTPNPFTFDDGPGIQIRCRHCDSIITAYDTEVGRKIECPECGAKVLVDDEDERDEANNDDDRRDDARESREKSKRAWREKRDRDSRRTMLWVVGSFFGLVLTLILAAVLFSPLPDLNEQLESRQINGLSDPRLAGNEYKGRGKVLYSQRKEGYVAVYVSLTDDGAEGDVIGLRLHKGDGLPPDNNRQINFKCRFAVHDGCHADLLSWSAR
jgi:predicted RNA-binding Zn-ribbon protein involved in translation (DUF1610 family)